MTENEKELIRMIRENDNPKHHNGATFVSFAEFSCFTREEQNSFTCSCFTSVDVSHDTDITNVLKWIFSWHNFILL